MRKTALAAALAVVTMVPGAATAGGFGFDQQSKLHLSGVELRFHFDGHRSHGFHGKHHRPHFRGHKRFLVPHHLRHLRGFVGRFDHRPRHFHRGFDGPKVWYYKPGHRDHFKSRRFKRRDHGHFGHRFKHRAFKDRSFKHWAKDRGFRHRDFKHRDFKQRGFKQRGFKHRDFKHRGRRHWRH